MNPCSRTPFPRNKSFADRLDFRPVVLAAEGSTASAAGDRGSNTLDPTTTTIGDNFRQDGEPTDLQGLARLFSFPDVPGLWSSLPTTSDHEPCLLEDRSQHGHGMWWAGAVDPRVSPSAPLVGAWQAPRTPHGPVRRDRGRTRPPGFNTLNVLRGTPCEGAEMRTAEELAEALDCPMSHRSGHSVPFFSRFHVSFAPITIDAGVRPRVR